MCGFAGVYGNITQKFDDEKIFSTLKHRGPDASGKFSSETCIMFHSRLTIIGNSINGQQPIVDKKNLNTLIYNGEIYNWKDLRNQYFPSKIKKIKSDTELILNLYNKLGINFVKKLRGIFSFVIFSKKDDKIFMVRDRFGVKPLFYKKNSKNIYFSSEIKSLLAMGIKKRLNLPVLKSYLQESKLCHNYKTFFKDIVSLEPATIYEISKVGQRKIKYWNLRKKDFLNYNSNEINELISDSIKSNLEADTEVGVALSSGIDSSIITHELLSLKRKVKAFSFGYNEKKYSEIKDIDNLFFKDKKLIRKNKILKTDDFLTEIKKAIYYFETPLGGLGTLSAFNLFGEVKKSKIKVLLSGEGGDELFGGYKYYFLTWLKTLYNSNQLSKISSEVKKFNLNQKEKLDKQTLDIFFKDKKKMFAPDGSSIFSNQNYLTKEFDKINSSKSITIENQKNSLTNEIFKDIFWRKLPKLLHFQDRASMANSVESRVPFLDHILWNKVFTTNPKFLFNNGYTKEILRTNFRKRFNVYPNSKKYVATPQREWLKNDLKDAIIDQIKNGKLVKENIINFKKWYKDYQYYSASKNLGNSFFVWKVLNAELLLKEFF